MKHDLTLLGLGPSMEGCPFDAEVWSTISILRCKGWEDKPYSKLFCFDALHGEQAEDVSMAQVRGLTLAGSENFVTEVYPLEEIYKRFGTSYFWNSVSYMIALALYQGYKSLLLYGIDQGPEPMYELARKYVTYWLGVADGMGVKWELAPNSILWRKCERGNFTW